METPCHSLERENAAPGYLSQIDEQIERIRKSLPPLSAPPQPHSPTEQQGNGSALQTEPFDLSSLRQYGSVFFQLTLPWDNIPREEEQPDPEPEFFMHPVNIQNQPILSKGKFIKPESIQDQFLQLAIRNEDNRFYFFEDRMIPFDRPTVGGAYCLLCRIPLSEPQLINGVSNEALIMKTFLKESILSPDPQISVGEGAAQCVIDQYRQVKKLGIPVPILFNETNFNSCGYFLFEYVPNEYFPSWDEHATIETDHELKQIRDLFVLAVENQLDLDLRPSNLRRKNDGTLVLVDFLESPPKKGKELYIVLENRLRTFCTKGTPGYEQIHHEIMRLAPQHIIDKALKPRVKHLGVHSSKLKRRGRYPFGFYRTYQRFHVLERLAPAAAGSRLAVRTVKARTAGSARPYL